MQPCGRQARSSEGTLMCRTCTAQHQLSHRTLSGRSCSHRSASPISAPPAPTSSSGLRARALARGCTLLRALPAHERLQPLSPHACLPYAARPPLSLALSEHACVHAPALRLIGRGTHSRVFCTGLDEFGGDDDPPTCWMTRQDVLTERSRGVGAAVCDVAQHLSLIHISEPTRPY